MRRLIAALIVVVGASALAGCGGRTFPSGLSFRDPIHPTTSKH